MQTQETHSEHADGRLVTPAVERVIEWHRQHEDASRQAISPVSGLEDAAPSVLPAAEPDAGRPAP